MLQKLKEGKIIFAEEAVSAGLVDGIKTVDEWMAQNYQHKAYLSAYKPSWKEALGLGTAASLSESLFDYMTHDLELENKENILQDLQSELYQNAYSIKL